MKKKLLVVLLASILLVSAVACGNEGAGDETSAGDDTSIQVPGTDAAVPGTEAVTNGNGTAETNKTTETQKPSNPDYNEENPTFKDVNKTLYVWYGKATIRTSTNADDDENAIGWPVEGTLLTATGESEKWYRIQYKEQTCYISKTVVGDNAKIAEMTEVNEEIEISGDVNVRTYPSTDGGDLTKRGLLKKGAKVTRVAKGEEWSCILFTVESETETTADGKPKTEEKRYFIFNECIKNDAETTAAETTVATEAATEAATEGATA